MTVHSSMIIFIQREKVIGCKLFYVQMVMRISHQSCISEHCIVGDNVAARYADLSAGRIVFRNQGGTAMISSLFRGVFLLYRKFF